MTAPVRIFAPLCAAALLVLGGCSSTPKIPQCPSAAILAPTSTLTTFKPGSRDDPTGELYTVGVVKVHTDCALDVDNGTTDSTLELQFKARRKATGGTDNYRVPYFVAVALDGKILAKRDIWVNFGFESGADTAEFTDDVASIVVNLENGRQPYDYQLVVGLQLTHDQLDYNKKMSRYGL